MNTKGGGCTSNQPTVLHEALLYMKSYNCMYDFDKECEY
jgi:hypothetical protein